MNKYLFLNSNLLIFYILGKTFQVVALTHTLLTHNVHTFVEKVLILSPVSTLLNWMKEFKTWLEYTKEKNIKIYEVFS